MCFLFCSVKATAINRADTLQRRGVYPPPKGESETLGLEAAGLVLKKGAGCDPSRLAVGDRVMALVPGGGNAELVTVNENHAMKVSEQLHLFNHYSQVLAAMQTVQYCDQEIVLMCAERRYQPIRIAYLLSYSILIGASGEISGAERTPIFPALGRFLKYFSGSFNFIEFCRLYRIQYIFCFKNILNEKIIAVFRSETFISYLNT